MPMMPQFTNTPMRRAISPLPNNYWPMAMPINASAQLKVEAMREKARAEGKPPRYDGTWRDRDVSGHPPMPLLWCGSKRRQSGETVIDDLVQGRIAIANEQFDDLILLRSDGTPTYMLSVVVDDHDMAVTHIIRGDDHMTNAARQAQIYAALVGMFRNLRIFRLFTGLMVPSCQSAMVRSVSKPIAIWVICPKPCAII